MSRTLHREREVDKPKSRNAARRIRRQEIEDTERRFSYSERRKEDAKQRKSLLGVSDF